MTLRLVYRITLILALVVPLAIWRLEPYFFMSMPDALQQYAEDTSRPIASHGPLVVSLILLGFLSLLVGTLLGLLLKRQASLFLSVSALLGLLVQYVFGEPIVLMPLKSALSSLAWLLNGVALTLSFLVARTSEEAGVRAA